MARPLRIKAERWEAFSERYGDWGRDLLLGRRHEEMTLKELAQEPGMSNYWSVQSVIKNFERRPRDHSKVNHAAQEIVELMTSKT